LLFMSPPSSVKSNKDNQKLCFREQPRASFALPVPTNKNQSNKIPEIPQRITKMDLFNVQDTAREP